MVSWERVGRVSFLVGSWAGSIINSDVGGYVTGMWVGGGVAIYWARFGCVPSSVRSRAGGDFPSDEASLAHISISSLSERFGIFRAHEVSFWGRPVEG